MGAAGGLRLRRGGVRLRILGGMVALLALANVATVVLERTILLDRLDREVEEALEQEVAELHALAGGHNPTTGLPFGTDVVAIFDTFLRRNVPSEGEVLLTLVDARPYKVSAGAPYPLDREQDLVERWWALQQSERGEVRTGAGPARYLAVPVQEDGRTLGVFVVAMFLQQKRQQVEGVVRVTAGVSFAVLVLAAALAWVVAGRVLAPVRLVTETARSLTDSDLTRRIPVTGDDEVAELATTFNEMLDRLERAFATQRAFLDDAGHELRTPITIIRGHLEVMGDDPDERRETLELVMDELGRMTRLVDDLLLLARAERPGFLQPETVDLAGLTRELHTKATALAPRPWELEAVGSGLLVADRQRVTQAFLNLARNAAQYSDGGAPIRLGSSAADGQVRLWVTDHGTGVDGAEQERIFERFARGAHAHRSVDGAGLGLAIARAVVDAHHGRIELDTSPGKGSTFTIVLPQGKTVRR
jgi:signal transduction histidine kinase